MSRDDVEFAVDADEPHPLGFDQVSEVDDDTVVPKDSSEKRPRAKRRDLLDQDPNDIGPAGLPHLAQLVYNALELVSDVGAASLGQHVSSGKPGHKILALVGEPPHLQFRRRWDGCRTDRSRREVITDGLTELRELRYARKPNIDCQTLDGRLAVGRDTRPARIVAHAFGYSLGHVYRLREEARKYDQRNRRAA